MACPAHRPWSCLGRYASISISSLPESKLTDVARTYLTGFHQLAVDGKAPALFDRAATGKSETAAAGSTPPPSTDRLVRKWTAVAFLVLDDCHVIKRGTVLGEVFEGLVTARFDACKATLYTGNLALNGDPWEALGARWGPMVARRMRDTATGLTVVLT